MPRAHESDGVALVADVISVPAPWCMTAAGLVHPSLSLLPHPQGRGILGATLLAYSKDLVG